MVVYQKKVGTALWPNFHTAGESLKQLVAYYGASMPGKWKHSRL